MGPLLNNEKIYFQSESPLNWWTVCGGAVAHGEDVIFHGRYNYLIRPNGTRGRLRNQFNVLTTPWREHCARRGREALARTRHWKPIATFPHHSFCKRALIKHISCKVIDDDGTLDGASLRTKRFAEGTLCSILSLRLTWSFLFHLEIIQL
jgi:hypothetical protein